MLPANRDLMRAINRFNILHSIRINGLISRVDIAKIIGLSQATVTGITAELIKEDLLIEKKTGRSKGGRRPVLLSLNPGGAYTVGVHISYDKICVVVSNLQASIIGSYTIELNKKDCSPETISDELIEAVKTCLWRIDFSKNKISGIGIALPGLVDSRSGMVHFLPNFLWKNIHFSKIVQRKIGIPTYIENSANTLTIFEQWFGVGRGENNFILITLEHGIGMGIVTNGQLIRGNTGIAGELGHTIAETNGPLCRCGQKGCLEAICGNRAILRDAKAAALKKLWSPPDPDKIRIEDVIKLAQEGETCLNNIYEKVGSVIGDTILNLQKLFDPKKIIFAGKGCLAGDLIYHSLQKRFFDGISFGTETSAPITILDWEKTDYAKGAAAFVLQEIYKSPANKVIPTI